MKEIIFATTNASKGKRFEKGLLENNIKTLTLKDINLKLDVEENGTTAIENARIKARECFNLTGKPSMGMDDTLYFENVPDDLQPGLFVRRVNGKTLNDEEMITHYTNLVKKYGNNGILNAKWVYGMVVINNEGIENEYSWEKNNIYLVDEVSSVINPGYPLNSITKLKGLDKYLSELTEEDKEKTKVNEDNVIEFITNSINNNLHSKIK